MYVFNEHLKTLAEDFMRYVYRCLGNKSLIYLFYELLTSQSQRFRIFLKQLPPLDSHTPLLCL